MAPKLVHFLFIKHLNTSAMNPFNLNNLLLLSYSKSYSILNNSKYSYIIPIDKNYIDNYGAS